MIPHILMSYFYLRGVNLEARLEKAFGDHRPDFFADSGAFTAFMKHTPINLDEYAAWLHANKHRFEVYSNLDVIGDETATTANQNALEAMGLHPLPVYHITADLRYLDALLERYSYIAIGGLVPYLSRPNTVIPKLIQCFKRAKGRAVFHGFGVSNWYLLKTLPWYSVDSTSWIAGVRFGGLYIFDYHHNNFCEFQVGKSSAYQYAPLIREYGFDPQDFVDRKRNTRALSAALSAASYHRAEQWIRSLHGAIIRPDAPEKVGLKLYLADVDFRAFTVVHNRSLES